MGACDNPRTYIPEPALKTNTMPDVPIHPSDVVQFLQTLSDRITRPQIPLPGLVQNFVGRTTSGGLLLKWDKEPNSFSYAIYRANTNNFVDTARIIMVIYQGGFEHQSWFDKYWQDTSAAPRYYWIHGYNNAGQPGPMSGPLVMAETT